VRGKTLPMFLRPDFCCSERSPFFAAQSAKKRTMLCCISVGIFSIIGGIDESTEVEVQGSLFESLGSIAADLFDEKDKYKLFATQIGLCWRATGKNWRNA
jgi:hypothetical protein